MSTQLSIADVSEWTDVNKASLAIAMKTRQFAFEYVNNHNKNRKTKIIVSLLRRLFVNLCSVGILSKEAVKLRDGLMFKHPIGLLLRSCYMDVLLGLYICCNSDDDTEEIADVLNLKYVDALLEQFEVYRDNINDIGSLSDEEINVFFETALEDTFYGEILYAERNADGNDSAHIGLKVMSKCEVRKSLPKDKVNSELQLSSIHKYLKESKFKPQAEKTYSYYRYFSQFEHFSERGFGNTIVPMKDDNVDMLKAVECVGAGVTAIVSQ